MDMRFDRLERAPSAGAEALPIDYRCFVAALAASQASTATARAAAEAAGDRRHAPVPPGLVQTLDRAAASAAREDRPAGSFHAATAFQASATELKTPFTLAFQPSFKPADYTDGIGQRPSGRPL